MVSPTFFMLPSDDPDVRLLRDKAIELHAARVEQRRRNLECLSAEGLIVLGRAHLARGNHYLAEAILAEFFRRLEQPADERDLLILRDSDRRWMKAVNPDEPVPTP